MSPVSSKFPSQIPVALALPFQLKLTLLFSFFLQLSLLFLTRIGLAALKHLFEAITDSVRPCIMDVMTGAICPQITPGNPCQPLLDLVLVQLFRLPPCDGAQGSQTSADMAVAILPRLEGGVMLGIRFQR